MLWGCGNAGVCGADELCGDALGMGLCLATVWVVSWGWVWCVMGWWHGGVMSEAREVVRMGMSISEFFECFPGDVSAERWFGSQRWPVGAV